jgi:RNA polymerase sigma-70 factor, ECF subfamily
VLRIDSHRAGEEWIVRAEGRLVGRWVDELRHLLASLGGPAPRIRLDLAELRYADGAGTRLLREQLRAGMRLERRSPFLEALLAGERSSRRVPPSLGPVADDDARLVERVLGGDQEAFVVLVKRHRGSMVHVARCYVRSEAVAEDIAQDAWIAVLRQLRCWEGRGSLRAWILSIVANVARARFKQESRTIPFSALLADDDGTSVVAQASALEQGQTAAPAATGRWRDPLESRETLGVIRTAIDGLPSAQRAVIVLRDVAGCEASEACATLRVSPENQRVLLHRARTRVRAALNSYFTGEAA